mgnify:FL=1
MRRTTLYGQIGSWDEGLGIGLDGAAFEWLGRQDTDRHASIFTEDRRLYLCPDDGSDMSGGKVLRRIGNRGRGAHSDFRNGAIFEWGQPFLGWKAFPRFANFEVKWHLGNDGLYLYAELPSDHLLPWPKLRDCASYTMPEQVVLDLEKRMRSARDAFPNLKPAQWTWMPMPKKFRDMLAPGVYGNCLKAVIAGEDYTGRIAA